MVDFNDLSGIRSFGRGFIGISEGMRLRRCDLGLDYGGFRVGWIGEFCVDFVGICPKGNVEWGWVSRLIFGRVNGVELLWVI